MVTLLTLHTATTAILLVVSLIYVKTNNLHNLFFFIHHSHNKKFPKFDNQRKYRLILELGTQCGATRELKTIRSDARIPDNGLSAVTIQASVFAPRSDTFSSHLCSVLVCFSFLLYHLLQIVPRCQLL